jgi:hypothetical protein
MVVCALNSHDQGLAKYGNPMFAQCNLAKLGVLGS